MLIYVAMLQWEKNGEKYQFNCQHGPKECLGNTLHACALSKYNFTDALNFVYKTEAALKGQRRPNVMDIMQDIAKKEGLNFDIIKQCSEDKDGQELLLEAGKKTKAVHPKITFVPTVVFNNVSFVL